MVLKTAELHVHLEGTTAPWLAKKLAQRNHLPIPEGIINSDGTSYNFNDFLHFLEVFDVIAALIKTPRDYYDITFEYLKVNALEGAIYIEMMYSPDHAERATGIPSLEHLTAIQQAINDARDQFDVEGRILLTGVRHFGEKSVLELAKNIEQQILPCVTGFGLGGDELRYHPKLFKEAYKIAHAAGLSCTVHAGEFGPASSIVEAIENLPIKRIGHGVQIIHSPETIRLVKERNIALELCPSSNIRLGLFNSFAEHPLPILLDAGIQISINSDDPPFMATTVGDEYRRVQHAYQYDDNQMNKITAMAITCAFVDEVTRSKLLSKLIRDLPEI
jgi:adenosine deaminase